MNKNNRLRRFIFGALAACVLIVFLAVTPVFATQTGEDGQESISEETSDAALTDNSDEVGTEGDTGQPALDTAETAGDTSVSADTGSTEGTGALEVSLVNRYDSADTCILVRKDELRQTVTFRNHDLGKNYTLRYDDSSYLLDESGRAVSISDFVPGDLVCVTFLKSNRIINSLSKLTGEKGKVSVTGVSLPAAPAASDIFCYSDIENYKLPVTMAGSTRIDKTAVFEGKKYLMDYRTLVLVDGKAASSASVMEGDLITAVGVGDEVYCVQVTKGHGYLRLSSTQVGKNSLVGAWIELDNQLVRKITDNMMLTTTEGDYTLYIVGQGANWSTPVTVTRGKETVIDTSGIPIAEPEKGIVNFMIAPKETGIIIDGEDLGVTDSVTLEYGIHTLELYAEGYETEVKYLRVASKEADIRLVLTEDGSGTASSSDTEKTNTGSSDSTASGSGTGTNASSSNTTGTGASSVDTNTAGTGATGAGSGTGAQGSADTSTGGSGGNTGAQSSNTGASWTSPSDSSQSITPGITIENQWIHVEAPTGAGLYVDGTYIGVIPCVFPKVTGLHTVNLRQDGYRIISYNIEVDTQKSDLYYRFPEMETE